MNYALTKTTRIARPKPCGVLASCIRRFYPTQVTEGMALQHDYFTKDPGDIT